MKVSLYKSPLKTQKYVSLCFFFFTSYTRATDFQKTCWPRKNTLEFGTDLAESEGIQVSLSLSLTSEKTFAQLLLVLFSWLLHSNKQCECVAKWIRVLMECDQLLQLVLRLKCHSGSNFKLLDFCVAVTVPWLYVSLTEGCVVRRMSSSF